MRAYYSSTNTRTKPPVLTPWCQTLSSLKHCGAGFISQQTFRQTQMNCFVSITWHRNYIYEISSQSHFSNKNSTFLFAKTLISWRHQQYRSLKAYLCYWSCELPPVHVCPVRPLTSHSMCSIFLMDYNGDWWLLHLLCGGAKCKATTYEQCIPDWPPPFHSVCEIVFWITTQHYTMWKKKLNIYGIFPIIL